MPFGIIVMNCAPDTTGKYCVNCGRACKFWRNGKYPPRNCDNPPDLRPAMSKLEWEGAIPSGMAPRLAKWVAEGMPERDAEMIEILHNLPCKSRRQDGTCGRIDACAKTPKEHRIACLWLARMETESCLEYNW